MEHFIISGRGIKRMSKSSLMVLLIKIWKGEYEKQDNLLRSNDAVDSNCDYHSR
jgi:hypothetical protein